MPHFTLMNFILILALAIRSDVCPKDRVEYNTSGQNIAIEKCKFRRFKIQDKNGGVICINSLRNTLSVSETTFYECQCSSTNPYYGRGGAFYTSQTPSTITSCRFQRCNANVGGAISSMYNKNITCNSCIFEQCTSPKDTAAVHVDYQANNTDAHFLSCRFLNCYHTQTGLSASFNTLNLDYKYSGLLINATLKGCSFEYIKEIAIRSEVNYMTMIDVKFSNINNSMESYGACMYFDQDSLNVGDYLLDNVRAIDIETRDFAMGLPAVNLNIKKCVFNRIHSIDGDQKIYGFGIAIFSKDKPLNIENTTFMDCKTESGCLYIESNQYMTSSETSTINMKGCLFLDNVLTRNVADIGASLRIKKSISGDIDFNDCIFIYHKTNEASSVSIDNQVPNGNFNATFENCVFNTTFNDKTSGPLHLISNANIHFTPIVCANDVDIGFKVPNGTNIEDIKDDLANCNNIELPVPTEEPTPVPTSYYEEIFTSEIPTSIEQHTSTAIKTPTEKLTQSKYVQTATINNPTAVKSQIQPTYIISVNPTSNKTPVIPTHEKPTHENPTHINPTSGPKASDVPPITEDAGKSGNKDPVKPATIAGIVIGCIIAVALCVVAFFAYKYFRHRNYIGEVNSDIYKADSSASYGDPMSSAYSNTEINDVFDDEAGAY